MDTTNRVCSMCGQPADPMLSDLIGGIWHTGACGECARRRLLADGGLALKWRPSAEHAAGTDNLGEIQIRPGAVNLLSESGEHYWDYLERHAAGDRGSFQPHAGDIREAFLSGPGHIVSEYRTRLGKRLWVMTAPGKLTSMLTPGEY